MRHASLLLLVMSLFSFPGCGQNKPAPELDRDVHLKSLYYSASHGYHAYSNIGYRAERLEDGQTRITVIVGDDRDRVFLAEGAVMDSLEALVREYRMNGFSGHYEPKMDILDGDSWSMELVFTDGNVTSCGGYMAYPPKGAAGIGKTEGLLSSWLYLEPAEGSPLFLSTTNSTMRKVRKSTPSSRRARAAQFSSSLTARPRASSMRGSTISFPHGSPTKSAGTIWLPIPAKTSWK